MPQPRGFVRGSIIGDPLLDALGYVYTVELLDVIARLQAGGFAQFGVGIGGDDRAVLDEPDDDGNLAGPHRRPDRQRTPQVRVRILNASDQLHHFALITVAILGLSDAGKKFSERGAPIAIADQIAVGIPIFNDVPVAIERQDLEAGIGQADIVVNRLILKNRIADAGRERNIKLFGAGRAVVANLAQGSA